LKEFFKNLKFAWKYTKGQKKNLIKYLIVSILAIIVSVLLPILYAKELILLTDNLFIQLIFISLLVFIMENVHNFINYLSRGYSQIIFKESFTEVQTDLGKNILKLENKEIDKNGTGVFIQRLTSDASTLSEIFNTITFWITNIITDLGIYLAVFLISKIVFVYFIISTILIYLVENRRSKIRTEKDKIYRNQKEKTTSFVGEIVRGIRDIKMLNAENNFVSELKTQLTELNKNQYEISDVDRRYNALVWFLRELRDFITIIIYILLITVFNYEIAIVLVLRNYQWQAFNIINHISTFLDLVKNFNLSAERVFAITNDKEFEKETFGTTHLDKVEGNFEFKNVHFSYEKNKVLNGLNFKVKANETVAFVGRSGAGKTTIFNLLCKMYEPNKGTITIDGINIKKLDKDSIRGNITIISQNPYIFNLSIRDNLRLVKEDLTEKEMIEACKLACLDEYIESLPDKYDTLIGEGGVNLSGGQKQRLAIARAFVQKTEIILFDEATSALDNETQSKIQEAIDNLKKDYTILIIAHRLSTIVNSDRILFLSDGKIKAEGTHQELLKECADYKNLYETEINK